jgi:hypothetical protein
MIYLPLLVLVCVTIWVAGWRKALEITAVSAFICLLFGLNFSGNARELPRNLWVAPRNANAGADHRCITPPVLPYVLTSG